LSLIIAGCASNPEKTVEDSATPAATILQNDYPTRDRVESICVRLQNRQNRRKT
jgi:hypothetical protein